MPIRILHVVTDMRRGGLETMLMNYYRQINRNKIQFDFLVHRDNRGEYDDEIESLGGNIYRMPKLNPFSPNYYKALDNFFKKHKYKIIHSHVDCMSTYPLKEAQKAGIPVRIAHAHSSGQDKNWKYPIKYISCKKIQKYATDYFACSQDAAKWMFAEKDFLVLKNAIDVKKYIPNEKERKKIKREFGLENDCLIIGHVGRFSYAKNHSFLIDVFYCIKKYIPDAHLILVGSGKGMIDIKRKVEEL
ncbi:MAG TPA: glycosyltransferase family 1 protein, partial [Terrisporobacter glycolicus]